MTTRQGIRTGLIGRSIGASASPAIHMREAAALGIGLSYELFDFDRLGLTDEMLGGQIDRLAEMGFAGVNITHPFKQAVIPSIDEIEPIAQVLGAVNCVAFEDGRKIGFNSDWIGFSFLMRHGFAGIACECVAQIGAGGAGSATAYALLEAGVRELRLFDTSQDRAEQLADRLAPHFADACISVREGASQAIAGADGVVQASPIGMSAHPGAPFDPSLLEAGQWLADIIYFPRETALVRAAKARGIAAVGGSAMVIGQAAEPFQRFTGRQPDLDRMLADFLVADAAGEHAA